jgi:hypothetical protein
MRHRSALDGNPLLRPTNGSTPMSSSGKLKEDIHLISMKTQM